MSPGEATPKPIPTFEMFEREVNAVGYSWVEMTAPEGWLFDANTKRLVRRKENIAAAKHEKNPPVKEQEEVPVNEADKATVASTASGSSTSTVPSSSSPSSSRKRRADSVEGSSTDDMRNPTPKRARSALPSEQFPVFASIQPLSNITKPQIPTIGGLQPFGGFLDLKMPKTMATATAKPKHESSSHRALRFRNKSQEDESPRHILKDAPIYSAVEPRLKRKAEEVDIAGNFEDSHKSKRQMKNHHMDKTEKFNTIDSTSEQLTKNSTDHHSNADQKPHNSNKTPTRAQVSTTLKDAMQKVQRNVQDALDMCAPFSMGLLKAAKPSESETGMKKSGSSSSTQQPSFRRAVRPKPKPYILNLQSGERSELSPERLRLYKEEGLKRIDSKDRKSSKQPTDPRSNVARPEAIRAAEDLPNTTINESKKPTGPASSAPATLSTRKPARCINSFELIGPRPIFECGVNGAHFLPLRFWQHDEDDNRVGKPVELPWPESRGITVEDLDWNSAEHIGWLNEWATRALDHFGC